MKPYSLYTYLCKNHVGKQNAVKSNALELLFNCKGTDIREAVNIMRSQGKPICSDVHGYYIAASKSDLSRTIKQLQGRVSKITSAIEGLKTQTTV